jgi:hypothetical protein
MTSLFAIYFAVAVAAPNWSNVAILGWTEDGSSVAWKGSLYTLEKPDGVMPCELTFLVISDAGGRIQKIFRERRWVPMEEVTWDDPDAEALWSAAQAEESGVEWLRQHKLSGANPERPLQGKMKETKGKDSLTAEVSLAPGRCGTAKLRIAISGVATPPLEDRCPQGAGSFGRPKSRLQMAWSPDGRRLALAWNTIRTGQAANDMVRGHFAIVSGTATRGK